MIATFATLQEAWGVTTFGSQAKEAAAAPDRRREEREALDEDGREVGGEGPRGRRAGGSAWCAEQRPGLWGVGR